VFRLHHPGVVWSDGALGVFVAINDGIRFYLDKRLGGKSIGKQSGTWWREG
jgi:hypothetical protein